jgi:tetratricopeptide (TPR) repeat protein
VAGVAAALLMGLTVLAGSIGWVARDQAARRAEIKRGIDTALAESKSWQRQRRMPEAISAARRAEGLLSHADVEDVLRQRVRARLADLELLEKMESVRLEAMTALKDGSFDERGADDLYARIFRDANLDIEALSAEKFAERIGSSTVAVELAAVLDHWSLLRRVIGGMDDPRGKRFLRIACAVDRDTWRTRLREAFQRRDWEALLKAAASEEVFRLPPATLLVLGGVLPRDKHAASQVEVFLREAQRRHPNEFWLNHQLYHFFSTLQPPQWEQASRFAAVAVALRPDSPGARLNLGNALSERGQLDEAIAETREAIRLKEDYAQAHVNLAVFLKDKGQLVEAIAELREAIRHNQNCPEALNNLGCALRSKGHLDEAIALHQQTIRVKPEFAIAHYNLGVALKDKGQLDAAITAFREAIRLKKNDEQAHVALAVALRDKGQLDQAIAECCEALRLKENNSEAHNYLGALLADKGQLDEAIREYREAIRFKKDYAEAHSNLGCALRHKGRLDEAIAAHREAIRLKKDFAEAHNNLGDALANKGYLEEAIEEFRECIRINKDYAAAHCNLGLMLGHKKRLDEAISEYREAVRLKEDFAEAHCNLGSALELKGQFAEALVHRRRGHELGSKNPHWPHPSAQWVRNCERLVELDSKLPAILSRQRQPTDAAERLGLAFVCHCKKQYIATARFYGEAFAEKPQLAGDLNAQHRYNAACAAALAGCGQGQDADKLDAKERARLRRQALDWLRADLKAYRQVMDKSAGKVGPVIAQRMQHWLKDEDFAGVRGSAALAKLPVAEHSAWQKLWVEVADTLTRAQRAAPAKKQAGP